MADIDLTSYIAKLVDDLRKLEALVQSYPSPLNSEKSPVSNVTESTTTKTQSSPSNVPDAASAHHHYQHHFAYAADSYRYLGSESCLVKSPRLQATTDMIPFDDDDDWQLSWKQPPATSHELVEIYLETVQPLYPILDTTARYLSPEALSPDATFEMTDIEIFSLNMVYSIACHVMPATKRRQHPTDQWNPSGKLSYHMGNSIKYRGLAGVCLNRAMEYLEASTSESNIDTLRAILLMAINSLFDPKTGNIGQQVALAARLALTLESQIELKGTEILHNMHAAIFSIENELASTLDRPATFPEPVRMYRDFLLHITDRSQKTELVRFNSFDPRKPADYLCSLYRLQHRFRKSDAAGREVVKTFLPPLDEKGVLLPGLSMALHQTHLLCNPCWGSAWYVLETIVSSGNIHNFLTPHWVYRAGTVLIQNMPHILKVNLIQLYSNALVILELSSWKWPSSATLSASLSETMAQMVSLTRPDWQGTLVNYDVRL
jgi:hypothetical protein